MKAVRVNKHGGADALSLETIDKPKLTPGTVLIKNHYVGVNFVDTYFREGKYPRATPFTVGTEGSGEIVEVSKEAESEYSVGDKVAFYAGDAYAEYTLAPAEKIAKIGTLSYEDAAATLLQGMTAHFLVKSTFEVKKGDWVLVHASAGGMGLILVSVCKHLGANVIGTCSTEEKAELSRKAGADHVVLYSKVNFAEEVKKITNGRGVDVIYDGVGKDTFLLDFECIRPRGMIVVYGAASGQPDPISVTLLVQKGSVFLTRPSLHHYTSTKEEFVWRSREVFEWVKSGIVKVLFQTYPLSQATQAHKDLEGRKTSGKVLLKIE